MTTPAADNPEAIQPDPLRVVVCANFVAEPLAEPLQYWLGEMGIASTIVFSPYNQVYQQLLHPASLLAQNGGGLNVIIVRLEEWCRTMASDEIDESLRASQLQQNLRDFLGGIAELRRRHAAPMIVAVVPNSPSSSDSVRKSDAFRKMEEQLALELSRISSMEFVSSHVWASLYPSSEYHDERGDRIAHIPYTPLLYSSLAIMIVRKFHKLRFPRRKVIVLDCDNTLWSGVVGEDGIEGISIGASQRALQKFVLEQQSRGMLVALCSRNNEPDVWEVFEKSADMVLKKQHFVSTRINWNSKSDNLASISNELGLGLDSFVFLDDDPVVCAEVRAQLPEVLTLLLPAVPADIPAFLRHVWIFDHDTSTEEDRQRTQLYQEHFMRERVRRESPTLAQFIASLNLAVEISPMKEQHIQRVSELTFRTNQFNTTGIRRSPLEVRQLLESGHLEGLVLCVKDRFGDYGLVGVVFHRSEQGCLLVDSFLLSCRALGRGVEHQVVAYLGRLAKERRLKTVNLVCKPSSKNFPAVDFLEGLSGAVRERLGDTVIFQLPENVATSTIYSPTDFASPDYGPGESTEMSSGRNAGAATLNSFLASVAESLRDAQSIHDRFMQGRGRSSPATVTMAPSTPVEACIGVVFCELLGLDAIDVHQGFFELGGHSLIAMQVLARVNEEFNVELTPMLLFTSKFAVADLAAAVVKEQLNQLDTDEVETIFRELSELTDDVAEKLDESGPPEDRSSKETTGN